MINLKENTFFFTFFHYSQSPIKVTFATLYTEEVALVKLRFTDQIWSPEQAGGRRGLVIGHREHSKIAGGLTSGPVPGGKPSPPPTSPRFMGKPETSGGIHRTRVYQLREPPAQLIARCVPLSARYSSSSSARSPQGESV